MARERWSAEDPEPLDETSETSSWAPSASSVADAPYWRQYEGIATPWQLRGRARAGFILSMVLALAVIVVVLVVWLVVALT